MRTNLNVVLNALDGLDPVIDVQSLDDDGPHDVPAGPEHEPEDVVVEVGAVKRHHLSDSVAEVLEVDEDAVESPYHGAHRAGSDEDGEQGDVLGTLDEGVAGFAELLVGAVDDWSDQVTDAIRDFSNSRLVQGQSSRQQLSEVHPPGRVGLHQRVQHVLLGHHVFKHLYSNLGIFVNFDSDVRSLGRLRLNWSVC